MDALSVFLHELLKTGRAQGNLLGLLHVLIGRKIRRTDGNTTVSNGLTWRDLAGWLKKVRWDPDAVRELGLDPDDLPPRDRHRYWYSAIMQAKVNSPAAAEAGERFINAIRELGYDVESTSKS